MDTKLRIELTVDEEALFKQIEFEALALSHDAARVRRNATLAADLMELLLSRGAIPEHRLRYFTDPDYHIGGRGSSRKERFERNGNHGREIFEHPHFLDHLRYFICGPKLPSEVYEAFEAKIEECGQVTSSDLLPIARLARDLARLHRLEPREASEELFKLGLEHGLSANQAVFIRDHVRRIR